MIDANKCRRDGICADQCPSRAIVYQGPGTLPYQSEQAWSCCLHCGHCVAACPQGAFSLNDMTPDMCPPVDKELLPAALQVAHLFMTRRSIRNFKQQPVSKELIEKLIGVANYAPSGHNVRPVHWLVLYDTDVVRRLSALVIEWMRKTLDTDPELARQLGMRNVISTWEAGYDRISRRAPHMILAHGPKAVSQSRPACTIALSYLEQIAYAEGLGACWAGFFATAAHSYEPLKRQLDLPQGHQCFGAMLLGYPQYQYYRIPTRSAPPIRWIEHDVN